MAFKLPIRRSIYNGITASSTRSWFICSNFLPRMVSWYSLPFRIHRGKKKKQTLVRYYMKLEAIANTVETKKYYLKYLSWLVKSLISRPESFSEDNVPGTSSEITLDTLSIEIASLLKAWNRTTSISSM